MQWARQLCIGVEFRLSSCTTGLLILASYASGQLSGCAMGQVNLVQSQHVEGLVNRMPGYATGYPVVQRASGYITGQVDHPCGTYTPTNTCMWIIYTVVFIGGIPSSPWHTIVS